MANVSLPGLTKVPAVVPPSAASENAPAPLATRSLTRSLLASGWRTNTLNSTEASLPLVSTATQETSSSTEATGSPGTGVQAIGMARPTSSLATGSSKFATLAKPFAATIDCAPTGMPPMRVIIGGRVSRTVMFWRATARLPAPSTAVHSIVVSPSGRPDAGRSLANVTLPPRSLTPGAGSAAAPGTVSGPVASMVTSGRLGLANTGGWVSVTRTATVHCAVRFTASRAV